VSQQALDPPSGRGLRRLIVMLSRKEQVTQRVPE
jgi:hypothetical protein